MNQGFCNHGAESWDRSSPYNPKIAYAFYRAGYIETWGRGIERITTACKEAGKREPLFEASPGEIGVTFFADINLVTHEKARGDLKDTVKDTVNGTQHRILQLLVANPKMTARAISQALEINERNVKKNIKTLKDADLIRRVGSDRSGYWVVKPSE
ncbi:MAG: winged helix-turn-helix transcriptional regulator [Peptococcaceae bacterium]|nr:winged helix-turn-helix transcriptional regulator [Peptococcaceae bacterium]